jgi:glyoxylase-like metal-dependent hydrolase (beta-lactamase superfamily II)
MKLRSFFLSALAAFTCSAQPDFSDVEIKVIPVTDGIYLLEGKGGNIAVSTGLDGILIVDDQFAPLADKIEAALGRLNPGPVRFVLNTHLHGDHTGGNAVFAGRGATLLSHDNVRKRLSEDGKASGMLPVITFNDAASVHFNDLEIRLIHHGPGHTDGDSVIHFVGANVVHMGDLMFNGRFPYVDLGNGGSVDGYIDSVETVLAGLPDTARIIPGHGPLATVQDLRHFRTMLLETVGRVRKARSDGKSLEEIKQAGLPAKYDEWGSGFISTDRWIETIYQDSQP